MKVTIVGQIKNDKTGLGRSLNDVIDYVEKTSEIKRVNTIDITNNLCILWKLLQICVKPTDVFYFTPSGSIWGNLRDSLFLFLMICRKKRIVTHFHNSNYGNSIRKWSMLFKLNAWLYQKVSKIIILGEKQQNMFEGMKIQPMSFTVLRNSVDRRLFMDPIKVREKHLKQPVKVSYFSNMISEKGYETVLKVAEQLKCDSRFQFQFSGKFFDETLKKSFITRIDKLENVCYYDGVYDEDKINFLQSTNFFVLPSRYSDETLPISMLEAMVAGCYIIVTDVGVISEVINPETTTLLKEVNASQIAELLVDKIDVLSKLDFDNKKYLEMFDYETINCAILKILLGN